MSGLLWAVLGSLGAALLFLRPLLVPLLTKDLEEGVPWFAAWLVRRAARKLPAKQRERFEEEWLAELTAVPGVMVFKLTFAVGVSLRARSTSRAMQGLPPWWEQILRRLAQTMAGAFRFNAEAARVLFGNPYDLPTTKVRAVSSISLLQLVRVALHEAYSIVKEAMLFLLEAYRSRSRRRRSKASFIQVKTLNSGIFIGDSSQKPPLVQRFDPDWQLAPLTLDDPGIDDDGAIKRLLRWHEELPADRV
jgi:hypothetical protein